MVSRETNNISSITLGTAQLGMDYGISNTDGKPDTGTALKVLKTAVDMGITSFDTSGLYGDSENIVGKFLSDPDILTRSFIISKLPRIEIDENSSPDAVYRAVKRHVVSSIRNLNRDTIQLYMIHHAPDMFSYGGNVFRSLLRIKDEGLIDMIGVSVYHPEEAYKAMELDEIEAVQIPVNLFDHRFIKENIPIKLRDSGKIVFARSVFLQGLFFLEDGNVPKALSGALPAIRKLREISFVERVSMDELAVSFVRDIEGIGSVILGVENVDQVVRNSVLADCPALDNSVRTDIMETFKGIPESIILPYLWKKT